MFNVTIKNVSDKALGELIAKIGTKKYSVQVSHFLHPDQEDIKVSKKNGSARKYMSPDTPLMITAKSPAKGTIREKALERFKKLEQKHGPGGVTRQMFRDELNKMDCDKSTMTSLIKGGFLRHVETS
jgi:hypothetical protein